MIRVFLLLIFTNPLVSGAQQWTVTADLQHRWSTYNGTDYKPYKESDTPQAVSVLIDSLDYPHQYLRIQSKYLFYVFLNHQFFIQSSKSATISLDSLKKTKKGKPFRLTIYTKNISPKTLSTKLILHHSLSSKNIHERRQPTFQYDFTITVFILIILIFILITRFNSKLAFDYISISQLFSLRESEDTQLHIRIAGSSNFLFYMLCSIVVGFYITLLIYYMPDQVTDTIKNSYIDLVLLWGTISTVVMLILFAKRILMYLMDALFNFRDLSGYQFFNGVKFLLLTTGLLVILSTLSIVTHTYTHETFQFMYAYSKSIIIGLAVLSFLKGLSKTGTKVFHLFSYLCITEIIPALVLLKILYH